MHVCPLVAGLCTCGNTISSIYSLLLCGMVAVLLDNNEDAEVFFEDATCVHPSSVLAWTVLGMYLFFPKTHFKIFWEAFSVE